MYKQLKHWAMGRSRKSKLEQFYSRYKGGKVLDVGVSGRDWSDLENVFLKNFNGAPSDYTALGIEDLSELSRRYPDRRFVSTPAAGSLSRTANSNGSIRMPSSSTWAIGRPKSPS